MQLFTTKKTSITNAGGHLLDISSWTLHILGMIFMLCDHLWATLIPGNQWLTWIGRLTFPIFAFMIAEGYFKTKDFKKYLRRMVLFALVSEIPFNLMYTGLWIFPFHQNVLWTFVFALLCMRSIDKVKAKYKTWIAVLLAALLTIFFVFAAQITMADYFGYGVMMVLVFYFFRGTTWPYRLGQLAGLIYINCVLMGGLIEVVELFGHTIEIPQQGIAVLSLIFIWCYHGNQGPYNKFIKYFYYAFYPVHLLILGLLSM